MVALGDLLLYLMEKEIRPYQLDGITYHTVFEEKEAYRTYFNKLCRKLKWFPTQNGMSGILLAIRFNAFMWKRRMPYRARWGLFENVRERRTERMLQKDLPVILCIPRVLLPWQREDRLPLYMESSGQLEKAGRCHPCPLCDDYRSCKSSGGKLLPDLFLGTDVLYFRKGIQRLCEDSSVWNSVGEYPVYYFENRRKIIDLSFPE